MQENLQAAEARELGLGQEKAQLKTALAGALEQQAGLEASLGAANQELLRLQLEVGHSITRPGLLSMAHIIGHGAGLSFVVQRLFSCSLRCTGNALLDGS